MARNLSLGPVAANCSWPEKTLPAPAFRYGPFIAAPSVRRLAAAISSGPQRVRQKRLDFRPVLPQQPLDVGQEPEVEPARIDRLRRLRLQDSEAIATHRTGQGHETHAAPPSVGDAGHVNASAAAAQMCAGVLKSGSPRLKS